MDMQKIRRRGRLPEKRCPQSKRLHGQTRIIQQYSCQACFGFGLDRIKNAKNFITRGLIGQKTCKAIFGWGTDSRVVEQA
jgi:hypothetical protein